MKKLLLFGAIFMVSLVLSAQDRSAVLLFNTGDSDVNSASIAQDFEQAGFRVTIIIDTSNEGLGQALDILNNNLAFFGGDAVLYIDGYFTDYSPMGTLITTVEVEDLGFLPIPMENVYAGLPEHDDGSIFVIVDGMIPFEREFPQDILLTYSEKADYFLCNLREAGSGDADFLPLFIQELSSERSISQSLSAALQGFQDQERMLFYHESN